MCVSAEQGDSVCRISSRSQRAQPPESCHHLACLAANWRVPLSGVVFIWPESKLLTLSTPLPTGHLLETISGNYFNIQLRQDYQLGLTRGWPKNFKGKTAIIQTLGRGKSDFQNWHIYSVLITNYLRHKKKQKYGPYIGKKAVPKHCPWESLDIDLTKQKL